MAKTTKPISIIVIGIPSSPELDQLEAAGHTIHQWPVGYPDLSGYDVILGEKCWRYFGDSTQKNFDRLIKEARAAQPKKMKKEKVK